MTGANNLHERAILGLLTADPFGKAALTLAMAEELAHGRLERKFAPERARAPERPARPQKPELLPPREMPKRKIGGAPEKRAAMLHALAHIELNAVDLALDMIARFDRKELPREFAHDWARVAAEEAGHFLMLRDRLAALGFAYGDFPAHDGLWEAAGATAQDVLARLAIVPLVLEARGLDVTPATIQAFKAHGDLQSCAVLERIFEDEIRHVATGMKWFRHVAEERGLSPEGAWRDEVRRHFRGQLKPPFNRAARDQAGMPAEFYMNF